MTGPVLFCFDGSEASARALSDGAALLTPRAAVVLTVWETAATQLATSGFAFGYIPDEGPLDSQEEGAARDAARRGAMTAEQRGWDATARVEMAPICVWQTVVSVADELDASLIVCGARGRNAAKRALLGSVAEAVLHHSHRLTLIAPQPDNPNALAERAFTNE